MNAVYFQGYIQDAYIVSGPNGYLKQCPNIETQCPTCGQYSNLLKTLDDLLKKVDDLTQRVSWKTFWLYEKFNGELKWNLSKFSKL